MKYSQGSTFPIGSYCTEKGTNFVVFSPFSDQLYLQLFQNDEDDKPLELTMYKTYYYWHIFVEEVIEGQLYGYRVEGKNHEKKSYWFDDSKTLVDPYSKAISMKNYSRELAQQIGVSNTHKCLKSVVVTGDYDWEDILAPQFQINEAIIYEMHPAGFTQNPNSKVQNPGTFQGIIEKVDYLKRLGINTIELMPVFAFDPYDAPKGKTNYWGYSPINFFAIHPHYCVSQDPLEQIKEFKDFIKKMHIEGFKVILDVVYNHTTEVNDEGPNYSFRGLANSSYYILDEHGKYRDYTGCGNTVNSNHSVSRRMILDSLLYWTKEMKVDGFRFDLASILARNEDGEPLKNPPVLWSVDSQPEMVSSFLIAEPWDANGLNLSKNFAGDKWGIWNEHFRDNTRKFLKGDDNTLSDFIHSFVGSPEDFLGRHFDFSPKRSINFVTAHDGFTLTDLYSYNEKHNLQNGEDNRDGSPNNLSWNCGAEGETTDEKIIALREKLIKNAFSLMLYSHGVPMLLMGDEIKRTQSGNNNAYCQDNELSWMDWDKVTENQELRTFVKKLIATRKKYAFFHCKHYISIEEDLAKPYLVFHGTQLHQPDWSKQSRSIAIEMIYPNAREHLLLIINMFWEPLTFELPEGNWELETYTGKENGQNVFEKDFGIEDRAIAFFKKC